MSFKVATLAVGTEVTDGQIVDRNSAILSQLSFDLGFEIVEHRAVPDDRDAILHALEDLGNRVQILFVTGGLGPTSDDFTREVIAKYVGSELIYDEPSWQHVVETLTSRGVQPREIQKQQCYFPKNATVHTNPAGTANAFSVTRNQLKIFALPGPPSEIMAVWKYSVANQLANSVPHDQREKLYIWRCLGRGESDIAVLVEPIVKDSGLRMGYRAHAPYVEVKVWARPLDVPQNVFTQLEEALSPYLVNRDQEDLAKEFLNYAAKFPTIHICDSATLGFLNERLFSIIREEKHDIQLNVGTAIKPLVVKNPSALELALSANSQEQEWFISLSIKGQEVLTSKVKPIYNHKVESERGRKYICEKALQIAVAELAKRA